MMERTKDGRAARGVVIGRVIGASAQALDDLPIRARLRLESSSIKRLLLMGCGYLGMVALTVWLVQDPVAATPASAWLIPSVVLLAFVFETLDSAAGMGFGTALAPLLLAMGYEPLAVVPVLLISETVTGLISAGVHHEFRNVQFSLKRGTNEATRLMLLIAGIGVAAIMGSVVLAYLALELPAFVIKTYVALLVLLMGCVVIARRFAKRGPVTYRSRRMIGFAALAGFNKGIGGGGYGPVITLGQLYSGVYAKSAAAITSLAEGLVSLAGVVAFFAISAAGVDLDFGLLPSALAGSALAAVASPYLVRILPNRIFSYLIPVYAVAVGVFVLFKLLLPASGA